MVTAVGIRVEDTKEEEKFILLWRVNMNTVQYCSVSQFRNGTLDPRLGHWRAPTTGRIDVENGSQARNQPVSASMGFIKYIPSIYIVNSKYTLLFYP
jgi:hypothetical protein